MTTRKPKALADAAGAPLSTRKRADLVLSFEENLSYRLSMLSFFVGKAIAELYREERMTSHQWKVLSVLCHFAPLSASQVERLITLDKSAISRAVQKLLVLELIERRQAGTDARSVHIMPTTKGKRLHLRVATKITEMQATLLAGVPAQDVRTLFRTFRFLEDRLRKTFADSDTTPLEASVV
jgi:DNA-binding MarR family transcriptional regulator